MTRFQAYRKAINMHLRSDCSSVIVGLLCLPARCDCSLLFLQDSSSSLRSKQVAILIISKRFKHTLPLSESVSLNLLSNHTGHSLASSYTFHVSLATRDQHHIRYNFTLTLSGSLSHRLPSVFLVTHSRFELLHRLSLPGINSIAFS